MEKVAIYIRLSKEDIKKIAKGDDSESIKNQKLMLSEYAATKGWQIYDFYVDEDYSGADRNRPSFDKLLRDAQNREFTIVICKTQNRFVRDLEAVEKIIHGKFLEWGIRFISLLDGADTLDVNNKKSRQIHGMVDEWYLEDLSKNIREVFKIKMEAGQFLGATAPYGYKKSPEHRHQLLIDEEAAKVVRKIYNLYLQGNGTHKIAKILTEEGIPKPMLHIQENNQHNFKVPNASIYGLWGHTTINRILRNPVYIGTLLQGKETTLSYKDKKRIYLPEEKWIKVEKTHQAIINEKDFYEVQRLLDARRKNVKEKGQTHIFATKVRCRHCGGTMIRNTTKSRRDENITYTYLKCKNNVKGGELICKYKNRISYSELYHYIEAEFIKVMGIYKMNTEASKDTSRQIKRVDYAEGIRKLIKDLQLMEGAIKDKGKVLTSLYIDKTRGVVSDNDYRTISLTIQEEMDFLELRKNNIVKEIDDMKKLENEKADIEKVIDAYIKNNQLTHEIVIECIDFISVGKNEDDRSYIIDVYWKL